MHNSEALVDAIGAKPTDQDIHDRIYRAILARRLQPGARLFGVSRTKIRAAIAKLTQDGVVQTRRNAGASVAAPTRAEARHVMEFRYMLEPQVVAALARARPAGLETLRPHIAAEHAARDANDDPASKPPEGGHCLKAGYWPLAGETFSIPSEGMPGALKHFVFYSPHLTLELNKTYQLNFKAKNTGMKQLHYAFTSHFVGVPGTVKVERGERGEIKNHDAFVDEWIHDGKDFDAGSDWTAVSGTISPRFKSPSMRDQLTTTGEFEIEFWATSMSNVIYFDNISLVKQGK